MIRFSWPHKGLTQTLADRCCQPSNKPLRFHSDLLAGFLVLQFSDQPSINGNLLWLNYLSDAELFKWFSDETSFDSFSAVILTSGPLAVTSPILGANALMTKNVVWTIPMRKSLIGDQTARSSRPLVQNTPSCWFWWMVQNAQLAYLRSTFTTPHMSTGLLCGFLILLALGPFPIHTCSEDCMKVFVFTYKDQIILPPCCF